MRFRKILLTAILSAFVFAGCQTVPKPASPDAKRYDLTGTIVSIDKAKRKASIKHEEIPGFMGAMTMNFAVRNPFFNEMKPGDRVSGTLVVDPQNEPDGYWLEDVTLTGAPRDASGNTSIIETPAGKIGAQVPDFKLVNQDDQPISLADFKGRNLVVTFIYVRCPLPDQCPLMSRNFAELNRKLQQDQALGDKTRLLSITFDPQHDTPERLREYAAKYLGDAANPDFSRWQLATGSEAQIKAVSDFFAMTVVPETNQIVHSLRTVVVTPEGKVAKIYEDNSWKPADVLRDLQSL